MTKRKYTKAVATTKGNHVWSGKDLRVLQDMHVGGADKMAIADTLGRTAAAVDAKLWKLRKDAEKLMGDAQINMDFMAPIPMLAPRVKPVPLTLTPDATMSDTFSVPKKLVWVKVFIVGAVAAWYLGRYGLQW